IVMDVSVAWRMTQFGGPLVKSLAPTSVTAKSEIRETPRMCFFVIACYSMVGQETKRLGIRDRKDAAAAHHRATFAFPPSGKMMGKRLSLAWIALLPATLEATNRNTLSSI